MINILLNAHIIKVIIHCYKHKLEYILIIFRCQGWGEFRNELELFNSIPELELFNSIPELELFNSIPELELFNSIPELELKDFEQVELELKDFEQVELKLKYFE